MPAVALESDPIESSHASVDPSDRGYPCSFNQEGRLLYDETNEAGRTLRAPHFPVVFRVPGPLNLSLLERALNDVIQRHDSLRTGFAPSSRYSVADRHMQLVLFRRRGIFVPGLYEQRIADEDHVALRERHVEAGDESTLTMVVEEEITAAASSATPHRPRAVVVFPEDCRPFLLVVLSHIIADGWSVQIFQRELATFYAAYLEGRCPPDLDVPGRYVDFVLAQHRRIISGDMDRHALYWLEQWEQLEDAAVSHEGLPFHQHGSGPPVLRLHRLDLGLQDSQAILSAARRLRASPYVLFRTAFTIVLHHYTGKRRLAIWANFANRAAGHENVFGWLANTHLLTVSIEPRDEWPQLCSQVSAAVSTAAAHATLPLSALPRFTGRSPATNARARVNFDLWPAPRWISEMALLKPALVSGGRRWMDLDVRLRHEDGRLSLLATYNASRYVHAGVTALLTSVHRVLSYCLEHDSARISEMAALSRSQRNQLAQGVVSMCGCHAVKHSEKARQFPRTDDDGPFRTMFASD